jgi:hypothetical protein
MNAAGLLARNFSVTAPSASTGNSRSPMRTELMPVLLPNALSPLALDAFST